MDKLINSIKQTAEEYRLDAALMKMVEKVEEQFKKDQCVGFNARSALAVCARACGLCARSAPHFMSRFLVSHFVNE